MSEENMKKIAEKRRISIIAFCKIIFDRREKRILLNLKLISDAI